MMCTRLGRGAAALTIGLSLSMSMAAPGHASAKKDKKLYDANKGSDRDGDGIACEKA